MDIKISPATYPLAFATDIVVALAETKEAEIVVELAIHNWPPTALTDSFSNVVVLNVPLITAFSNSAVPFPSADIFHPDTPLAKFLVCNIPTGLIIILVLSIASVEISQPPIEADTNLANPNGVIEAEAFCNVDATPSIRAGVRISSADIFPTKVPAWIVEAEIAVANM